MESSLYTVCSCDGFLKALSFLLIFYINMDFR